MKNKKKYAIASSEMVDQLINDYYADDYKKMEILIKNVVGKVDKAIDIDEIVENEINYRESLKVNVNQYEDDILQLLDLATVLAEKICKTNCDEYQQYINYLIEKMISILPNIIDLLQIVKNRK